MDTIFSMPFLRGASKGPFRQGLKEVETTVKAGRPNPKLTLSGSVCASATVRRGVPVWSVIVLCMCDNIL